MQRRRTNKIAIPHVKKEQLSPQSERELSCSKAHRHRPFFRLGELYTKNGGSVEDDKLRQMDGSHSISCNDCEIYCVYSQTDVLGHTDD